MSHRRRRIRWPVLVAAGVLAAGSGTAYAVTSDGSTGSYRTVRAGKGDVEELLSTTGTVDAAHRADLNFGTSGTVASVSVAVGDTVKTGQVVARLDTDALEAAVTKARASVAKAVAQLETDENAQDDTVSDAAASPQPKPKDNATPSPSPGVDTTAALQQLKEEQAAVLAAQSAATAAIAAAKDALAAQTAACADAYQHPSGDESTAQRSTETSADQTSAQSADDAACSQALAAVQARQDEVSAAQDALQKALDTLAGTLTEALATLSSSSSSSPSHGRSAASRSVSQPSSDGTTPASDGSDATSPQSGTASAAQLAADQAGIEQARADLVDARQQLRQAVLRSTRSGKVVSVPVSAGDRVSAGDTGAIVVGGRAVTIEASVPESKIAEVKVGEPVRVTTPGSSTSAAGTVTAIGLVADSSSGTPSYPVTVTVENPTISLPSGSRALLAIVVATAKDVVTVPTSAITRRGDASVVRTWDGTKLSRKTVTVGTVGAREVEITKGLDVGDEVVLADLDQAISGAADSFNDRGGFGGPIGVNGGGPGGGPITFQSKP